MPTPGAQSAAHSHHVVTLNYTPDPSDPKKGTFVADPRRLVAKKGHSISFKLGKGPANGKVRVMFKPSDQARFSAPVFNDGDPQVSVIGDAALTTTYHCELLVDGKVVAESQEFGGEVELAPGT